MIESDSICFFLPYRIFLTVSHILGFVFFYRVTCNSFFFRIGHILFFFLPFFTAAIELDSILSDIFDFFYPFSPFFILFFAGLKFWEYVLYNLTGKLRNTSVSVEISTHPNLKSLLQLHIQISKSTNGYYISIFTYFMEKNRTEKT